MAFTYLRALQDPLTRSRNWLHAGSQPRTTGSWSCWPCFDVKLCLQFPNIQSPNPNGSELHPKPALSRHALSACFRAWCFGACSDANSQTLASVSLSLFANKHIKWCKPMLFSWNVFAVFKTKTAIHFLANLVIFLSCVSYSFCLSGRLLSKAAWRESRSDPKDSGSTLGGRSRPLLPHINPLMLSIFGWNAQNLLRPSPKNELPSWTTMLQKKCSRTNVFCLYFHFRTKIQQCTDFYSLYKQQTSTIRCTSQRIVKLRRGLRAETAIRNLGFLARWTPHTGSTHLAL